MKDMLHHPRQQRAKLGAQQRVSRVKQRSTKVLKVRICRLGLLQRAGLACSFRVRAGSACQSAGTRATLREHGGLGGSDGSGGGGGGGGSRAVLVVVMAGDAV